MFTQKSQILDSVGKKIFSSESGKVQLLQTAELSGIHGKGVCFRHPLLCRHTPPVSRRVSANILYCSPPGKFPVACNDFLSTGTAIRFLMLSTHQEDVKFVQEASVPLW